MSDAVVTPTDGASVSIDPSAQPAAPAAKPPTPAGEDPSWIAPRLERERSSWLKQLGAESFDAAKKAIDAAKAAEESAKSDAQKRGELETTLKSEREEKQAMAEALSAYAKGQMGALTEEQRNAVAAVAGNDPAKQLKTIEALKPTWVSAAVPAAPAAAPPPKDTAPAPAAPKDGAPSASPDVKAIYEELQKTNPILASRYALANGVFENK